ncbi:MAG: Jag N-terminal domain-containing protein [Dictyoglomus sp.]|nr:Jag N-terminal domain-containing protein [Dictyoglomus sp.]MCX7845656.1 Jag N-terminal domain-containing protein [Dictyoglomaceae bacterium]MDW8189151.1 RNA-binding cell elongation regulator Jag/EloR [Dictyoglomus sp.]
MKEVETEGKTLEEALKKAQLILEVPLEEIEYEILEIGKEGILGIGAKPYRVYARIKKKADDILEEFLKNILKRMELKVRIKKIKKDNNILFSVEGENLGRIIGYNGRTLSALEFILRLYGAKLGIQEIITLDIDHYRERREFQLINLAKKIAKRVKEEKRKIALNPLPARERRIIHIALQEDPFVYTYSEGEEPKRRVIIAPREE